MLVAGRAVAVLKVNLTFQNGTRGQGRTYLRSRRILGSKKDVKAKEDWAEQCKITKGKKAEARDGWRLKF